MSHFLASKIAVDKKIAAAAPLQKPPQRPSELKRLAKNRIAVAIKANKHASAATSGEYAIGTAKLSVVVEVLPVETEVVEVLAVEVLAMKAKATKPLRTEVVAVATAIASMRRSSRSKHHRKHHQQNRQDQEETLHRSPPFFEY